MVDTPETEAVKLLREAWELVKAAIKLRLRAQLLFVSIRRCVSLGEPLLESLVYEKRCVEEERWQLWVSVAEVEEGRYEDEPEVRAMVLKKCSTCKAVLMEVTELLVHMDGMLEEEYSK
jgi:hypothetical protein